MDWATFEADVFENVGESLYSDQVTAFDHGDDVSGLAFTIGETWQGALYGLEENGYGQHVIHRFDTESEQGEWFEAVSATL